jgi:hypothetical protein
MPYQCKSEPSLRMGFEPCEDAVNHLVGGEDSLHRPCLQPLPDLSTRYRRGLWPFDPSRAGDNRKELHQDLGTDRNERVPAQSTIVQRIYCALYLDFRALRHWIHPTHPAENIGWRLLSAGHHKGHT